jgi:hypothetical protein
MFLIKVENLNAVYILGSALIHSAMSNHWKM